MLWRPLTSPLVEKSKCSLNRDPWQNSRSTPSFPLFVPNTNLNLSVYEGLEAGTVAGRVVLDMQKK